MKFGLFFFASGDDPTEQYRLLLEASRIADAEGLTAVWTPERHFHEFGAPFPNPAVTGAAVAAVTERLEVRAGSVVLPLHDPLRVAEEWAVVDHLSGGRAGIAVASGWNPRDFVLAPKNFADNKAVMREGIAELRALWKGEAVERVGVDGTVSEVRVFPRPRRSQIPMWITAAGSPQTFELAGELGAGVLTHLLGQSWDALEDNLVGYADALERSGHGADEERVAVMMHTFLSEDSRRAVDICREPMISYLRTSMDLFRSKRPEAAAGPVPEDALREMLEQTYQDFQRERCLIGTVEDCAAVVRSVAALGVDEIACLIDFGVATDEVLESVRLLAKLRDRCEAW